MKKNKSLFISFCLIIAISMINLVAKEGFYKIETPLNSNIELLEFFNKDFGVIISEFNEIIVTLDGGNSFTDKTKNLPKLDSNIYSIVLINTNEIYFSTYNAIYYSKDTCNTWNKIVTKTIDGSLISCKDLNLFPSNCYCINDTAIYSSNNIKDFNFKQIQNVAKEIMYFDYLYYVPNILDSNLYMVLSRKVLSANRPSLTPRIAIYHNNNIVNYFAIETLSFGMIKSKDNGLILITDDYIIHSTDYFITSDTLLFIDSVYKQQSRIYENKNNSPMYVSFENEIKILKNKKLINCKIDNNISVIKNIKTISINIAFAQILSNKYFIDKSVTNYFLKTEDGGGVDLSDVEQEEPSTPQIEFSTDLQLYDLLGRQIATYDNYYKLKTEITNFTPPHLIKWRDASGVYHFEKMK